MKFSIIVDVAYAVKDIEKHRQRIQTVAWNCGIFRQGIKSSFISGV